MLLTLNTQPFSPKTQTPSSLPKLQWVKSSRPLSAVAFGATADVLQFGASKTRTVKSVFADAKAAQSLIQDHLPELRKEGVSAFNYPGFKQTKHLTPLVESDKENVLLKLENQTAIGAYKLRGAFNAMSQGLGNGKNDFVAVSTGNHALAVLKAAELLKPESVTVYVPEWMNETKLNKLKDAVKQINKQKNTQANIVQKGVDFKATSAHVDKLKDKFTDKQMLIHPFDDDQVVAGQATIGLELSEQLETYVKDHSEVKEVVVVGAVGGGGLMSGTAVGLSQAAKESKILKKVKIEFIGARPKDIDSQFAGANGVAEENQSKANMALFKDLDGKVMTVSDDRTRKGLGFLKKSLDVAVEGAAGQSAAIGLKEKPNKHRLVVVIVSGGNANGDEINASK